MFYDVSEDVNVSLDGGGEVCGEPCSFFDDPLALTPRSPSSECEVCPSEGASEDPSSTTCGDKIHYHEECVASVGAAVEASSIESLPLFDETAEPSIDHLADQALFLQRRLQCFAAKFPDLRGLSKLMTRMDKEVEMAFHSKSMLSDPSTAAAVANRPNYLQCNCIPLLELTLHTLEQERDVVAVMYPVNEKRIGAISSSRKGRELDMLLHSVEVDIVSCGGLRWVKIKGSSRRNMAQELAAASDRRPFAAVVENLWLWARRYNLPFGQTPELAVLFYYRPDAATVSELSDDLHHAIHPEVAPSGPLPKLKFCVYEDALATALVHRTANGSKSNVEDARQKLAQSMDDRFEIVNEFWALDEWSSMSATARHQQQGLSITTPVSLSLGLPPLEPVIQFINFDVTALVALCTDTCNGHATAKILKHPVLDEQSQNEATERALLDFIEPCLARHTTVVDDTAHCKRLLMEGFERNFIHEYRYAPVQDANPSIDTVGEAVEQLEIVPATGFPFSKEQCEKLHYECMVVADDSDSNSKAIVHLADLDGFVALHSSNTGRVIDETLVLACPTLRHFAEQLLPSTGSSDAVVSHRRLNWLVSEVVLEEFLWILGTIAGPHEYRRAVQLLRLVYVVKSRPLLRNATSATTSEHTSHIATLASMSRVLRLESTGKITDRHKVMYGLGDIGSAITLTANRQFAQAARDQGVRVCVCLHPSRALTERKRTGEDRIDGPRKPPALSQI